MKKILLMIPAYNEAENIGALLKQMKEAGDQYGYPGD